MARQIAIAVALVASLVGVGLADVKLPGVLSDNMVLQQGQKITIWGTADAGEKVAVALGAAKADATADDKGKWQVVFEPLAASDKPIEMTVAGKNTLKVANILVGEVWLCSGQSNMQMPVQGSKDAAQEIASADFPSIRLMNVGRVKAELPQEDFGARWVLCSPKTVGGFSAAGYFFGREIHKALKVPVGLINSSWGGSPIEAWIPMETYQSAPFLAQNFLKAIELQTAGLSAARETYATDVVKWKETTLAITTTRPGSSSQPGFPRKPQPPESAGETYGGMYNAMVAPLTRLKIAGVIWYQGEANSANPSGYQHELPAMIGGWRKAFGQEFPFLFVQLPNFQTRGDDPNANIGWATFREAQETVLSVPKTGMAVTIDVGEAKDIHPKDKQTVGHRLALVGLGVVYGKTDVVYQGPTLESMKVDGEKVVVTFKHSDGGLVGKGDNGQVSGFAIAGADGKYAWADAKIDGNSVTLTSKVVTKPVAVRYAFNGNPAATLYNKFDLPAVPFRAGEQGFTPATAPATK